MFPIELQAKYPKKWDEMMANEHTRNQYESFYLRELLNRNGFEKKSMKYYKTVSINDGQNLENHFSEYKNLDVIGLVVNYIDILGHAKSESKVIGELLHDESAYRDAVHSWFENSWFRKGSTRAPARFQKDSYRLYFASNCVCVVVKKAF